MSGNIKLHDIYQRIAADADYQRDNFYFRLIRNLVKTGKLTRRHGMALWNLYEFDHAPEKLFIDNSYPALTQAEACEAMHERGYEWIDSSFYENSGGVDRWEPKSDRFKT